MSTIIDYCNHINEHKVKYGESLSRIANKNGTTVLKLFKKWEE